MTNSQQKAQEGHLEEEEATRPTKGIKSGKTTKRAWKAQKSKKSSKSTLPPWNQLPLTLSMQVLPLR
jgi:hypothetical protein